MPCQLNRTAKVLRRRGRIARLQLGVAQEVLLGGVAGRCLVRRLVQPRPSLRLPDLPRAPTSTPQRRRWRSRCLSEALEGVRPTQGLCGREQRVHLFSRVGTELWSGLVVIEHHPQQLSANDVASERRAPISARARVGGPRGARLRPGHEIRCSDRAGKLGRRWRGIGAAVPVQRAHVDRRDKLAAAFELLSSHGCVHARILEP